MPKRKAKTRRTARAKHPKIFYNVRRYIETGIECGVLESGALDWFDKVYAAYSLVETGELAQVITRALVIGADLNEGTKPAPRSVPDKKVVKQRRSPGVYAL